MTRIGALITTVIMWLALFPGSVAAAQPTFTPGAPGVGDPYFPLAGNGGYDVKHYRLAIAYDPETDVLRGTTRISAMATKNLSRFNLDLDGLRVRSVKVDGHRATWTRGRGELRITPRRGLRKGHHFSTVIRYDGVPQPIEDELGLSGFIHTDDGAVIIGEPEVAATWFPVNDHPSDKASYTFHVTVPKGLEAVANGVLADKRSRHDTTTWTWVARERMASYLATATMGEFDLDSYRADGIRYWDAIDPVLLEPPSPRTGERYAISQSANLSYKRLTRTISVPADGAQLSFWVTRDTEPAWDFMFVEAHTPGEDDWTTLPDVNDHNSQDTGASCPFWLQLHPFLTHYQADNGDGTCAPEGSSGDWWAASGASDGYEQWTVDLSPYAGGEVEVSISYASDDVVQGTGLYVDDVEVSTGEGSTSFEDDGDPLDGWTVPGAPEGSEPNPNDWIAGTVEDTPPTAGEVAQQSFARQPEIIAFLSDTFGPYPFSAAGGIVDDAPITFALENQTRPIYSTVFFDSPVSGDAVVVHELAHQWYGDSLTVKRWRHIWLNEGFATYAEWLWSEREGFETAQELFDSFSTIPADDPFWSVTIGDPGPDLLFDGAVYYRGAMTLHALRVDVGDRDFFRILRRWARTQADGLVTTGEFIRLAERVSGQQLDDLFDTWLFTPQKPDGIEPAEQAPGSGSQAAQALEQQGMGGSGPTSTTAQRLRLRR